MRATTAVLGILACLVLGGVMGTALAMQGAEEWEGEEC